MPRTHPPAGPTREAARRRLRSLAGWELLNVPLQAWLWFRVVDVPLTAANIAGFGSVAALLVVGAAYWALKLRQLRLGRSRLPGLRHFATARAALPVLLVAVLAACAVAAVRTPGAQSYPGLAFGIFAVLEYVNYFHVQLMHDNRADLRRLATVGFRRAHLARDLRAAR
ncbi:hypothetical protein [Micromonospora echinofusca]|uniref:hypothetical protein n=1 Tax=Micromonospora echinofusca TaxID=47858 RepID=UPI0018D4F06F|nr:hypothetical protein [Micromonospora echinofusca]